MLPRMKVFKIFSLNATKSVVFIVVTILIHLMYIVHISNLWEYEQVSNKDPLIFSIGPQKLPLHQITINFNLGRFDKSRRYKIFDNIVVGSNHANLTQDYNVTLATQTSIDRIDALLEVAEHWTGPVSVAIYAAEEKELNLLLFYLSFLRYCVACVSEQIVFHLLVPWDIIKRPIFEINFNEFGSVPLDCSNTKQVLDSLVKLKPEHTYRWLLKHPYPQNHLRNVARKNSGTRYVLLTDIDIIPCYNLARDLNIFLNAEDKLKNNSCGLKDKCVYVIPTFEIDYSAQFPNNKTELILLKQAKKAQVFHHKIFPPNQFATNIARWEKYKDPQVALDQPIITKSHSVGKFKFFWEPFYVSLDTVPPHDERFLGYGLTRNTQVYETLLAGYKFVVLSPVFLCHWGFQVIESRPQWRPMQMAINSKKFNQFKNELMTKYNITNKI